MALADYRLCDVCDSKAFYDANLNYEIGGKGPDGKFVYPENPTRWAGEADPHGVALDYLGDWAVICTDCAKTHKCIVVPIAAPKE